MSSLSDLEIFERHSFRWGKISEDDAPMKRVADDVLEVTRMVSLNGQSVVGTTTV